MDSLDYVVKKILGVIRNDVMKYISKGDSTAIVKRVDGDTAWVHFDGGVPETPVAKSINCKKGDKVRVRNSGGTPFLVGNDTAPPTDDTKAEHAQTIAEGAEKTAEDAQTTASEAQETAISTSNYFWHVDGTGSESGAHVTRIPKDEFLANPSGGNLFLRADAVNLRNGIYTLASFRNVGMTLGDSNVNVMYGVNSFGYSKFDNSAINIFYYTADNSKVSTKLVVSDRQNTNYVELKQVNGAGTLVTDAPIEAPKATLDALDVNGNLRGTTETISISSSDFAVTTGSISSVSMVRFGNVVQLTMQVTRSSDTSAGNNCFVGKLNLTSYRPALQINCASYSGSVCIVGNMDTDGTMLARVTGAQLPANRSPVLTFTYLVS